jgi:hypothetical protein
MILLTLSANSLAALLKILTHRALLSTSAFAHHQWVSDQHQSIRTCLQNATVRLLAYRSLQT